MFSQLRHLRKLAIPASGALLGAGWFSRSKDSSSSSRGSSSKRMKRYTLSEVQQHCTPDSTWVSFKGDVYDVTPFLGGHPGLKSRILMAGGQDLEKFWEIYTDHYRGHVIPWMQRLKIGTLSESDAKKAYDETFFFNAYDTDPVRHNDLLPCTYHPFNGECLIERLTEHYYTPNELHYVRNHLPVPEIDPEDYTLTIHKGNGIRKELVLTLDEIKNNYKHYDVVSPLQCAGNRREDFHGTKRQYDDGVGDKNLIFIGPHWVVGAFSCARWTGVRLREILRDAGMDVDAIALGDKNDANCQHIHFTGTDCDETGLEYGVSIPIDKAVDGLGDVMIAFQMNGVDLPADHGYPCRALCPGFAGARNCKWIKEVAAEPQTSMKPWHENAYRGFAPDVSFEEDLYLWEASPNVHLRNPENNEWAGPIGEIALEQPVQSITCNPPPASVLGCKGGLSELEVRGVAWSGGGRNVHRCDVSIDGGKTFFGTDLFKPRDVREREIRMRQWGWYHWKKTMKLTKKQQDTLKRGGKVELEICSKACNGDFNVQPENPEPVYNSRGIQINHYYRVPVTLDGSMRKGKVVRDTLEVPSWEGKPNESFRNRPTGGHFRLPWEPEAGEALYPFPEQVVNKTEFDYENNRWWEYDNMPDYIKMPKWKGFENLPPNPSKHSIKIKRGERFKPYK